MTKSLFDIYEDQLWNILGKIPGVDDIRLRALKAAAKTGMPTNKSEDWRYGDLKKLRGTAYGLPVKVDTKTDVTSIFDDYTARIVFVNGRFSESLSDLDELMQAANVRHLANHMHSGSARPDELIVGDDPIAQLNTALMTSGIVISLPSHVELDDPIEIIHLNEKGETSAVHLRHIIEMGEGSRATIVERYIGDDSNYWTNTLTQVRVSERANLTHIRLQEEGVNAVHTHKVHANLGAEATYGNLTLQLGANYGRTEAHIRMLGDEAHAWADSASLAGENQTLDTVTHINHIVPNATSDQVFRAVLDKKSKTAFQGKVSVAKDAQKTLADQSCRSLLLDRTAEACAKPELEILADDVKCSHGATVGELDEKAYFYLISRGIEPKEAKHILVEAFAADALLHIEDDSIRELLNARLLAWMVNRGQSEEKS